MRQMALSYGVYASYQEKRKSVDDFLRRALTDLTASNEICNEDLVVVLAGNFSGPAGFSFIEVGRQVTLRTG
jgi:pyruvate kinase